ncbi:MAG: hypothetical protein IPK63_09765 [Candidatus Competibacteraceae bacterium]|nr:hypothetical protein [Candidatus Competibacteraceae bacterium]
MEALGHRFRTHSDWQIILHAYETWGEDCVGRLWGCLPLPCTMPGVRMLLVRDRLGIKPLYFATGPEGIGFASIESPVTGSATRPSRQPDLPRCPQNKGTSCAPQTPAAWRTKLPAGRPLTRMAPGRFVAATTVLLVAPANKTGRSARHGCRVGCYDFDTLINQVVKIHLRSDVPLLVLFLPEASFLGAYRPHPTPSPGALYVLFPSVSERLRSTTPGLWHHNGSQSVRHRLTACEARADELLERLPPRVWGRADDLTADYPQSPGFPAGRAGG